MRAPCPSGRRVGRQAARRLRGDSAPCRVTQSSSRSPENHSFGAPGVGGVVGACSWVLRPGAAGPVLGLAQRDLCPMGSVRMQGRGTFSNIVCHVHAPLDSHNLRLGLVSSACRRRQKPPGFLIWRCTGTDCCLPQCPSRRVYEGGSPPSV